MHGKCLSIKQRSSIGTLTQISVPKAWFLHFYIFGLTLDTFLLVHHIHTYSFFNLEIISLLLMEFHFIRRVYECIYVTIYRPGSRMFLIHYLLAMSYYFIVSMSLYFNTIVSSNRLDSRMVIMGTILFIAASFAQNLFHTHLRDLRCPSPQPHSHAQSLKKSTQHYKPYPTFFPWSRIYCPHYTAEIFIYASLCIILHLDPLSIFNLVFVMTNLSISALETKKWSQRTLEKDSNFHPSIHRAAIFPGIL